MQFRFPQHLVSSPIRHISIPCPFFSLFFSFCRFLLLSKTHNSLSYRLLFLTNLIPFHFHTYTGSPTFSFPFLHFPLAFLVFNPITVTLCSLFPCNWLHPSLVPSEFFFHYFLTFPLRLSPTLHFLNFPPLYLPTMNSSSSRTCFSHSLCAISPARGLFISISPFRNVICSAAQARSIIIQLCPGGREREGAGGKREGGSEKDTQKANRGENGVNIHLLSLCSTCLITSMFLLFNILSLVCVLILKWNCTK